MAAEALGEGSRWPEQGSTHPVHQSGAARHRLSHGGSEGSRGKAELLTLFLKFAFSLLLACLCGESL